MVRAAWAPALGPFMLVAGHLGLDGALEACATKQLPSEVVVLFAEARWTIEDLPSKETAEQWLLGIRVIARKKEALRHGEGKPRTPPRTVDVARALGVTVGEAVRAREAALLVTGALLTSKMRRV